ncbi:MAG TPA: sigma 54-interacting transcriptional regulator [Pyrinomonadaceae bacterium]|nr:sigma 54-interacting transcriptional regulator [Pyrinomonadaceae bacterium]
MNKSSLTTKEFLKSGNSRLIGARSGLYSKRQGIVSDEQIKPVFLLIEQKLTDGFSNEAEKILTETIERYNHSADNLANLKRLLSYTLETLGRYKESLEAVKDYESEELLEKLPLETQIKVVTQLAISYNNLTEHPKAVTLLKRNLKRAKQDELKHLFGSIYIALSRVYRKLNEYPISRDLAEKALNSFREDGNWSGMAESYQAIAVSHYQEGNNEKSLEYFQLAIQIVGDRPSPFMLGKIYSDMSGAYCQLHRPQEGIACLEKSIRFFEQTEHKLNSVIAYNNLGMNLMVLGDWSRAEKMMKRALDLATEANHVHVAGILDSIGELKYLRGELAEAEELLNRAVSFANERKKDWYAIMAMRNLARCLVAEEKYSEAIEKAKETIEVCKSIGEKQTLNTASLVLAESYLQNGDFKNFEAQIQTVEENAPATDFFILGNIQRLRGLEALQENDSELAVHHFSRSLTIFEAADDLYHSALAHFLIGTNLGENNAERALKHLTSATEIFNRLGVKTYLESAKNAAEKLKQRKTTKEKTSEKPRSASVVSQLLTVRLAEATASRELLFRELIAVLQQESRANKIIIAEPNEQKKLYPFIAHGYVPNESMELVEKFQNALLKNESKSFATKKNLAFFHLKPSSAVPAYLLIAPQSGAILNDESSLQPLLRVVELGMDVISLREKDKSQTNDLDVSPFTSQSLMSGFIHSSPAMTALVEEVYKIRSSDVTVLVTGESGTGKELVSRAIHTISSRKDKIFIPFNCTAVPKELAEGHLFGYRKGAFTGAVTDSPGMIRAADGGTLFLDEVGDLPLDVQPKLLRFLQEGEVQPIGEKRPIKVDVRVIAATNMPLEEKVADGSFREDLYYRLNVIRLRVPPLRERRSEIPPMINYYVNHYSSRFNKNGITIMPQTIDLLMVCDWDGNVRQLCNEIQRIVARADDGETITPEHLSPELKRNAKPLAPFGANSNVKPITSFNGSFSGFNLGTSGGTLEEAVSQLETQMITDSLTRHNWNISQVARELGLTRRGLYMKIERYGIEKAA